MDRETLIDGILTFAMFAMFGAMAWPNTRSDSMIVIDLFETMKFYCQYGTKQASLYL